MIEDDALEGQLIGFCQLEMNEDMRYQVKAVTLSPDQLEGGNEALSETPGEGDRNLTCRELTKI